eukprot:m.434556 g.434556  ORF g.434556 m.434556 type:complete len:169 (-) comp17731_c0_seq1:87-593(-)
MKRPLVRRLERTQVLIEARTIGMGCGQQASEAAATGTLIGAGYGSVKAAWAAKPEVGNRTAPLLVNTVGHVGRWAVILGGASAVYGGAKCTAVDMREKDDVISSFFGGCAAGATVAFKTHRVVDAVTGCAALGGMAAMVKFAGEFRPDSQTSTKYVDEMQKKVKDTVV